MDDLIQHYTSVSAGRGKWAKCNIFLLNKMKLYYDQTVWFFQVCSTVLNRSCPLESKDTFVFFLLFFYFWKCHCFWPKIKCSAIFEVRIKPSCDYTFTAGPNLMCSSSWPLNSDDFPFFWILYCSSRTQVTAVLRLINICWNFCHMGASSQTQLAVLCAFFFLKIERLLRWNQNSLTTLVDLWSLILTCRSPKNWFWPILFKKTIFYRTLMLILFANF